jgi:hypothetical protein
LAQLAQAGPAHARVRAPARADTRLSLCSADPTCQSVPNLKPTSLAMDVPTSACSPTTFSSPRHFRSRMLLAHFPSLTCALSQTLSSPLFPYARDQTSSVAAHRRTSSVLRPSSSPPPVRCLGEFSLVVSYLGHPSVCPFHLCFAQSALTGALLAQPEPAAVDPRLLCLPTVLQALRVHDCGKQPSHALNSSVTVLVLAQFLTGVDLRRR